MSDVMGLNGLNTEGRRFDENTDELMIPLNIGRHKDRKTANRTMTGAGLIAGPVNYAIRLLTWIQSKLDEGKITVPLENLAAVPGPYADDAAASAGGVPVGGLYYETTTGIVNVRLV